MTEHADIDEDMTPQWMSDVVILVAIAMENLSALAKSIVGIYEEQAARKQYDILGDGSV